MESLQAWYQTPLGAKAAAAERSIIEGLLADMPQRFMLQLGDFGDGCRINAPNATFHWLGQRPEHGPADCTLAPENLPFLSDSLDAVLLLHTLEFSPDPHRVLREAVRALVPDGVLMALVFNPVSPFGLRRMIARRTGSFPWWGRFIAVPRIQDWFRLLDVRVSQVKPLYFRLPWGNEPMQSRLDLLDRYGLQFMPWLASAYLAIGRKEVRGLTPLRPIRQKARPKLVAGGVGSMGRTHLRSTHAEEDTHG